MTDSPHDPIEYANQLSKKISSSSRRVNVFLGSGASATCGLPTMELLKESIFEELDSQYDEIVEEVFMDRNLEAGLSRLRKIQSILGEDDQYNRIDKQTAEELDQRICEQIISELSINGRDLSPMVDFATWVDRTRYDHPVEIFTTNYDLALDTALENTGVNYFDGFIGNIEANFKPELVEMTGSDHPQELPSNFARLWKVHGSVNWVWRDRGIVRLGDEVEEESAAAIYPAETKYEESRRVPFLVLQDRLRRSLFGDELVSLIAGYGFNDQHINELFFRAIKKNPRSDYIAFCYGEIPEIVAEHAIQFTNFEVVNKKEAIIGGEPGRWDESADDRENVWDNGEFQLVDFEDLAGFMSRNSRTEEKSMEEDISELLETIANSE